MAAKKPKKGGAVEELRATVARIDQQLARLEGDAAPAQLAPLYGARLNALGKIARFEREVTEAEIVKSSAWRNMLGRMETILAKHPACASELAHYLDTLSD